MFYVVNTLMLDCGTYMASNNCHLVDEGEHAKPGEAVRADL